MHPHSSRAIAIQIQHIPALPFVQQHCSASFFLQVMVRNPMGEKCMAAVGRLRAHIIYPRAQKEHGSQRILCAGVDVAVSSLKKQKEIWGLQHCQWWKPAGCYVVHVSCITNGISNLARKWLKLASFCTLKLYDQLCTNLLKGLFKISVQAMHLIFIKDLNTHIATSVVVLSRFSAAPMFHQRHGFGLSLVWPNRLPSYRFYRCRKKV